MTRWPVIRGVSEGNFLAKGRAIRTGQVCIINKGTGPLDVSSSATGSVKAYSPSDAMDEIRPERLGGTIILWVIRDVSLTSPITSPPPVTFEPDSASGTKCHFFPLSKGDGATPLLTKGPVFSKRTVNGL